MLRGVVTFAVAAGVVLVVGPRMARTADRLAKATGMGGALFGMVFLALATDLPEIALTPTAVLRGSPRIAVGGLLGAAAAQLLLIAVVDMAFVKGRLPGQLSLQATLAQCALMTAVLAVPLMVVAGLPTFGFVGVGTVLLALTYLGGLAAIRGIGRAQEVDSGQVQPGREEVQLRSEAGRVRSLWLRFGWFALLLAGAGAALESATELIGSAVGLEETAAGALIAGIVSPLPELVTAVSAARAGALDLAVGDLVGSSALDVALLAFADLFYTDGSVFQLLGAPEFTLIGVSLAITALLILALARGEPVSAPRVGLESYLMVAVYVAGVAILLAA